ncbi:MAG: Na+/H+ antiporter NhaA [Bacteroidales bacterium]|nr:Na+/H+ antiporter NhaA [Bacteroidales bacterium]MDD6140204.1 Na+/H+ antiporter NhaA [Bacteroidales bacterium]MDD6622540.1 Na+/H+ antiporter NhaA [Bacteroidales bacterium]
MEKTLFAARKTIMAYVKAGNPLIVATILALVAANLPVVSNYYFSFWNEEISLKIGDFNLFGHGDSTMNLMTFINDALMAIFFFTIGLEIKREVLVGELSSLRKALLPIIAAIGGMVVPIVIFHFLSVGEEYSRGAAIPMATDIAFSLGVLAMLGSRVPISLKIFLTTLAVVDDIGGILVIATCYTSEIHFNYLLYAGVAIAFLILGNIWKIQTKMYYILFGLMVWYCFLNSGIHPTIAGVIVAFCIPAVPVFNPKKYIQMIRRSISHFPTESDAQLDSSNHILTRTQMDWLKQIESASDKVISPLQDLEDTLHPLVNFIIIPLFAFANAGISIDGMQMSDITSGVGAAVVCGLVLGKFLGIFSFTWLSVRLRLAPMPYRATWKMIGAVSVLGGIGFTVSLFIANLSFPDAGHLEMLNASKLGILVGSLLSAVLGYLLLNILLPKRDKAVSE